ncbi:NADH-quinone oxidoreductase subunit D [Rickettsiales bacterium LUAb2]
MNDKEVKNTLINFGPQHPAAHGVLRLVVELDGEIVRRAEPQIGQLHRGTEKLMEYKTYLQSVPFMDRLDYVTPFSYEHGYVLAIEKLLQCNIPLRAKYLRVIFAELSRINHHIFNIGAIANDAGAMTPLVWAFEEREKIMEFFEHASGGRMHMNYVRPGGLAKDIPAGLADKIYDWTESFINPLSDIDNLITNNRIFKQRTVDIGIVVKEEAINYGFTGPNLRASGVAWDLRKSQPYEIYNEIDFDIVVGSKGDSYERFLVRLHEIYQSLKIIKQCLSKMPEGPVTLDDYEISPPKRAKMKTSMEALIHHFKLFSEGINVPKGEVYSAVETPAGEFGMYLVSEGGPKPYRAKLKSNGLAHLQAIKHMAENHQLADIPVILGTLCVVFGEIDR